MKFRVGDLCTLIAPHAPEFHGRDCMVLALAVPMDDVYSMRTQELLPPGMFYEIDVAGDGLAYVLEHELRLKRPPSWDTWILDTRHVEHETKTPVLA